MSSNLTAAPLAAPVATRRVDELCDFIEANHQGESGARLCEFARIFFRKLPRQLLHERSVDDLSTLTKGAFAFLGSARPDEVNVQVLNPEEEGWSAPVTVIRAEVGDRPFIVDSIREYLSGENLAIQHYMYPVLCVHRAPDGSITGLSEAAEGESEALVHCEISRIADPARRAELADGVKQRLYDVMAVTEHFDKMLAALDQTIAMADEYVERFPDKGAEYREAGEFMRWLRDENFVFLGFRSYEICGAGEGRTIRVQPGSGLGILREENSSTYADEVPLTDIPGPLLNRIIGGPSLIISKTNAESTVHRRARMDYIGVKRLGEDGNIVGECRFLGLFTSKAYTENAETIPILRRKLDGILETSSSNPGSHDYKEIITIFNSMPKEDLFQASPEEIEQEVQTILALLFSDDVHVTLRPDPLRRGVTVMAVLPRGRFSGEVRQRIQEMLTERFQGTVLNYHLALSAGDQARLHFFLSASPEAMGSVDAALIERETARIIRSWDDRLLDALAAVHGSAEGNRLLQRYGAALSDEYRAATLPEAAVHDIEWLERMERENRDVAIDLRKPRGRGRADDYREVTVLKLYLRNERLILSDFMPILDHAGVRVVEVVPFSVAGADLPQFMIYSFAVQDPEGGLLPTEKASIFTDALLAVRRGDASDDIFNTLVLSAGLHWREVDVLRAYANYAFQIEALPTRFSPARALIRYPEVARLLIELFRAKFDPEGFAGQDPAAAAQAVERLRSALGDALDGVVTLADDRAFRRLISLMEATTRTNYFRYGGATPNRVSGGVPYISFKIRSGDVEELSRSGLLYEIFVQSSRMEGIHLRGAAVSRGGIRWSDRPDDFRTEVLGLVTTQVVKNAVIVPGGSKGGFIIKRVVADRDEMMQEAAEQYRTLIRGMLDVTDNIVDGEVVPPPRVVRYDGDDPYLVVAADKGTAHLSDAANAVAHEYEFWLDDAFASGGSHGYDHKAEGITARGAWECVKRHFREMGKDIQEEPFTVAGIGDMSGDVFGNGMLLSRQIKLTAAFDHRHVFIDPDPDPETSVRERERMFALPRSSWEDYNRALLSEGGTIVPRTSKSVQLSEQAQQVLGLPPASGPLDGEALVRAVLRAPVELLWNGGIGTYVKHPDETHAEAGDPPNDPVRVNVDALRCQVVGEGGNLGFTQPARVAFAETGGRINTDALDNSAGVDMSDHEVNLKILLKPLVAAGEMTPGARNELLAGMTERVSELVLAHNFTQSLAVSLDWGRSRDSLGQFVALIAAYERDKLLERGSEGIPTTEKLQGREEHGNGLTRPTLAVLLAFTKLQAKAAILASTLPDDPAAEPYLIHYFPDTAVARAGAGRLRDHRLRREIIATAVTNDLIDLMGSAFLVTMVRESGATTSQVVRAWLIASGVSGAAEIRADLARLEGRFPAEVVYRWYFGLARVLAQTSHWALANVSPQAPTLAVIEEHRAGLARLRSDFADLVAGPDRALFLQRVGELEALGAESQLAQRLITLRFLPQLLNILRIAQEAGSDALAAARSYYKVSDVFGCAELRHSIREATGPGGWETRHAQLLVEDIDRTQRALTRAALAEPPENGGPEAASVVFERMGSREGDGFNALLTELRAADHPPLAAYAVAVRALSELAR